MLHVHIGAGKLGLGMVGEVSNICGLRLVYLNYNSGGERHKILAKTKQYFIELPERQPQKIPIYNYHVYEDNFDIRDPNDPISTSFANDQTLLVTTSTGIENMKRLEDTARVVCHGLWARKQENIEQPVFVIACENLSGNSTKLKEQVLLCAKKELIRDFEFEEVDKYIKSSVYFCDCIVDRICSTINTDGEIVSVPVGSFFQWVIDVSETPEGVRTVLESHLSSCKQIKIIYEKKQFNVYRQQKLWCLNGIHLAVAVFARKKNILHLAEALKDQRVHDDIISIQTEFGLALHFIAQDILPEEFTYYKIINYSQFVLNRIKADNKDTCTRILRDLILEEAPEKVRESVDQASTQIQEASTPKEIKVILSDMARAVIQQTELSTFFKKIKDRVAEPANMLMFYRQRYDASYNLIINFLFVIEKALQDLYNEVFQVLQLIKKE